MKETGSYLRMFRQSQWRSAYGCYLTGVNLNIVDAKDWLSKYFLSILNALRTVVYKHTTNIVGSNSENFLVFLTVVYKHTTNIVGSNSANLLVFLTLTSHQISPL